jgi:nitrogen regulatory protein P-II 1
MNLVLLVLHDPEKLQKVLAAWEDAGISGATVLFNTGLGRIREDEGLRDDIPLIPSIDDFFSHPDHHGRTIFTISEDDSLADKLLAATENVLGDLNIPGSGIFTVLPVSKVKGLQKLPKI